MGSLQLFKELQLDLGYDIEFRQSGSLTAIHTPGQYDYMRDRDSGDALPGLRGRTSDDERGPRNGAGGQSCPVGLHVHAAPRPGRSGEGNARFLGRRCQVRSAYIHVSRGFQASLLRSGGGYSVETNRGEFVCESLVIAAGAWCGPLGRMLGLDIPIVPVRGQMWATESLPPSVFQTQSSVESAHAWSVDDGADADTPPELTHKDGVRATRHLYGRQRRNGEIIFGGDRQMTGYDKTVEHTGIEVNKGHASEVIPMLSDLPIARTWGGLMPFSMDGAPIIGGIPSHGNLYIVSGLASSGFGRGPMAGKLLADFIHTGHRPQVLT